MVISGTCDVHFANVVLNKSSTARIKALMRGHTVINSLLSKKLRQIPIIHYRSSRRSSLLVAKASIDGEIAEVADLKGIRVTEEDDGRPRVEYLVQWKDGSADTWEPATNLADDLLRDYEQRWWGSVRKGEEEKLYSMLNTGGPVLARTVDDARRSALHFAAALGKPALVQRLLSEGAEVDLADKEGE